MTIRTKIIGRLPQNKSEWDPNYVNPGTGQRGYGKEFRVFRYGCELESKIENNTYDPFEWDGDQNFVLDVAHWELCSGNPKVWAAGNPKPATTGTTGDYPYNGMGRVVIPKNMQNIAEEGDPENIVNLLTQDAFEDGEGNPLTNTIYVIQYDFVLGEDITIPADCVLKFEGGSLDNGELYGNSTIIDAELVKIFGDDIELSGSFSIDNFYTEWHGAKADGVTVCNTAFQKSCDNSIRINAKIQLLGGTYIVKEESMFINFEKNGQSWYLNGAGMDVTFIKVKDGEIDRLVAEEINPRWIILFDHQAGISGKYTNNYAADTIKISNITFDLNKRSNTVNPPSVYAWESNCIFSSNVYSSYVGTVDNYYFENIHVKDKIGSGLKIVNQPAKVVSFDNIVDYDTDNDWGVRETIYPLAICEDIKLTRLHVNYLQIETLPSQVSERYTRTVIDDSYIGGLEWDDETLANPEKSSLIIANSTIDGHLNFSGNYSMKVHDCIINVNKNSTIFNAVEFNNCKFHFSYVSGTLINIWHRNNKANCIYTNCSFVTDEYPEGGAGSIFKRDVQKLENLPFVTFNGCSFDVKLDSNNVIFDGYGAGKYHVEDCIIKLNSESRVASVGAYSEYSGYVEFINNKVVNDNKIFGITASAPYENSKIVGEYKNEFAVIRSSGSNTASIDGEGFVLVNDNAPIPCDGSFPVNGRVKKNGIMYKVLKGGFAINTTIPISTDNYTAEFVEKKMSTTTRTALQNLPALPMEAYDTDLNKPVYWTGSAWVDATGTPV